ncbi:hypothetical protein DSO57_1001445 [Entomophthora muscae]|uniref:Uncharacterized protein n=1 Tax=Entomophthora muscae TaxID=34485 RepID=A0ACC2UIJ6_9FUNG|nr:hypothetical protein DSO57_1001445 [Entomophthora muscae]
MTLTAPSDITKSSLNRDTPWIYGQRLKREMKIAGDKAGGVKKGCWTENVQLGDQKKLSNLSLHSELKNKLAAKVDI